LEKELRGSRTPGGRRPAGTGTGKQDSDRIGMRSSYRRRLMDGEGDTGQHDVVGGGRRGQGRRTARGLGIPFGILCLSNWAENDM
jgi:hypothetical protein